MVSGARQARTSPASSTQRRLDAPERYIHMQVDRLRRALRTADGQVERGDMKAVAPLIKLIGALDRYHGLDARYRREPRLAALPPAAAAPLALAPPAENLAKLSESDMQVFENAFEPKSNKPQRTRLQPPSPVSSRNPPFRLGGGDKRPFRSYERR